MVDKHGIEIVGTIPASIPPLYFPFEFIHVNELILASASISLIGYLEHIAIAKNLGTLNNYHVDPGHEMVSFGKNIVIIII